MPLPETVAHSVPRLVRDAAGATRLHVAGRPVTLLAGECHNSASSSVRHMDEVVWPAAVAMNLNALLAPITWELTEPTEGHFDLTLLDALVAGARARGTYLVPLWFGAYKNTWSTYAPAWVRTDLGRFPRTEVPAGEPRGQQSVLDPNVLAADARAFAAVMRRVRELDPGGAVVPMVQVQNEVGLLGSARDRSPAADAAFAGPVPRELTAHLAAHEGELREEVAAPWRAAGRRAEGSWTQVFGSGLDAEEFFSAWHFGRYCATVAAAGRAEHDLPMFVNAWLVQHPGQQPGGYPSGGPVARVWDVWRAAVSSVSAAGRPVVELTAPDIYIDDFADACADYVRERNPLLVPESKPDEHAAARALYAVGEHAAIGFAPFGFEGMSGRAAAQLAEVYRLLGELAPLLGAREPGRVRGALIRDGEATELDVGGYRLRVASPRASTGGQANPVAGAGGAAIAADAAGEHRRAAVDGGLLAIALADDEFLLIGYGVVARFLPAAASSPRVDFLELWEGDWREGRWLPGRCLNGDERHLRLDPDVAVRRCRVYAY
ncbi:MAG TPA: DUF5597 domain-containing protein [Tepidisphaeraceae bacterium]|jgi:hypothetical protein|nr:DUF5597 domain-containing protein [Tepidisphaeraceae bacterium]